jgi:hypothetical protein
MDLELVAWVGGEETEGLGNFLADGRRKKEEEWGWKALERREAKTGSAREGDASGDDDEETRGGSEAPPGGASARETQRIGGNRVPSTFAGSTPGPGFYRVRYRVPLHPVQELGSAEFTGPGCYAVARCSQPKTECNGAL